MEQRKIKLSILDQSIVRKGGTARQAVSETIATVKLAERLGYTRFWVSEHHNSTMIAGSTLEVLILKLADETKNIRKEQVKEQLTQLTNDFDVYEVVAAAMTFSQEDRIRSFEFLAEAFDLEGRNEQ